MLSATAIMIFSSEVSGFGGPSAPFDEGWSGVVGAEFAALCQGVAGLSCRGFKVSAQIGVLPKGLGGVRSSSAEPEGRSDDWTSPFL